VNFGDQYHVGMVVDDLQAAKSWFTETSGYRWCDELNVENILVDTDGGSAVLPLRFTYTRDEPRLELVQSIPGTVFTASMGMHLGYWSDGIEDDVTQLEKSGGTSLGMAYWPDGGGPLWALALAPWGALIELVDRAVKPSMERWWETGVRAG
jgi:lactoylglutathione lyase